jgi:acyl dehydratase
MSIKTGHVETVLRVFSQSDFDRFAILSNDINPIHVDPVFCAGTRFGKPVAHGMMLYAAISSVLGTRFPGPGTLQVKQNLMFQHPTVADTPVTIRLEVLAVEPDAKRACIQTDIFLPDKTYACTGQTTVMLPGANSGLPGIDPAMLSWATGAANTLNHLKIGQNAETQRTFSATDLAEYANLTGDTNPLFTDETFAQHAGFDRCLVPGPLLGAMFSDLLGTQLPGRGTNWLKQQMHFPAPAYVGDEILARVEIMRLRPEKDLVNLVDTCTNGSGDLVCQAQSLVLVRDLEKK